MSCTQLCIYSDKSFIRLLYSFFWRTNLSCFTMNRYLVWFLSIIFSSFLACPSLCGEKNTTANRLFLATCLADSGVNNFTLLPYKTGDNRAYYDLLGFPIRNLRFTLPSLPKPAAVVIPGSKKQLTATVRCCRKGSMEIRVRSGGHSYEGTSSVAMDGLQFVIIDLSNLNNISIDLGSKVAWVEGGATLGETYYAIAEASKVHGFAAGSCPTVGVGGHISGGGFGLLSRKYGVAADNVVDALLVDADGRVLDRKSMGEDVFWAIRGGGGGNWGIIYAWKIKLLQVPETVTAFQVSRPGTKRFVASLLEKWQRVAPKLGDDFYLSLFLTAGSLGMSASFTGFYLGPKWEFMSTLNEVFPELKIPPKDYTEMTWIESVYYFSGLTSNNSANMSISRLKDRSSPAKTYFKAKSDYVMAPIASTGIRTAFDKLEKEPKGYVLLDPYGGFMEKVSGESIAFPHRRGNLFSIQYMVDWSQKDEQEMKGEGYIKWIRGFYKSMSPYVSQDPRAAYVNYMDLDLGVMKEGVPSVGDPVARARVWGEKYFLNNFDRLVRAKTLIDPLNVFRHQQSIPPMSTTSDGSRVGRGGAATPVATGG